MPFPDQLSTQFVRGGGVFLTNKKSSAEPCQLTLFPSHAIPVKWEESGEEKTNTPTSLLLHFRRDRLRGIPQLQLVRQSGIESAMAKRSDRSFR
jgi:hypothetical protein